jgi:hypothetical protein
MSKSLRMLGAISVATLIGSALVAADPKVPEMARPKPFDDVVACKSITDPLARLACYDEKVAALDEAAKKEDIILTDKAAVKEAKRGLFGFDVPKIRIFGNGEDVEEIEATVKSVSITRAGMVLMILEDGARWQQVDTKVLNREPRTGSVARIRKATMGSYLVSFDGGPAIRMKRLN